MVASVQAGHAVSISKHALNTARSMRALKGCNLQVLSVTRAPFGGSPPFFVLLSDSAVSYYFGIDECLSSLVENNTLSPSTMVRIEHVTRESPCPRISAMSILPGKHLIHGSPREIPNPALMKHLRIQQETSRQLSPSRPSVFEGNGTTTQCRWKVPPAAEDFSARVALTAETPTASDDEEERAATQEGHDSFSIDDIQIMPNVKVVEVDLVEKSEGNISSNENKIANEHDLCPHPRPNSLSPEPTTMSPPRLHSSTTSSPHQPKPQRTTDDMPAAVNDGGPMVHELSELDTFLSLMDHPKLGRQSSVPTISPASRTSPVRDHFDHQSVCSPRRAVTPSYASCKVLPSRSSNRNGLNSKTKKELLQLANPAEAPRKSQSDGSSYSVASGPIPMYLPSCLTAISTSIRSKQHEIDAEMSELRKQRAKLSSTSDILRTFSMIAHSATITSNHFETIQDFLEFYQSNFPRDPKKGRPSDDSEEGPRSEAPQPEAKSSPSKNAQSQFVQRYAAPSTRKRAAMTTTTAAKTRNTPTNNRQQPESSTKKGVQKTESAENYEDEIRLECEVWFCRILHTALQDMDRLVSEPQLVPTMLRLKEWILAIEPSSKLSAASAKEICSRVGSRVDSLIRMYYEHSLGE